MERRVIAHLDADAFYATCHLQAPGGSRLSGKPVVVGGLGPRSIVTTASYEARRFGIHSAMPMVTARRLCPQAIVIPPDRELYSRVSQQMWDMVRAALIDAGAVVEHDGRTLAYLEQAGIDEGYADLTALTRPLPMLRELIAAVHAQIGIQLSVGVSPSKLVSKIASDLEKPASFVVLSREMALERLAARKLEIVPGIGPKTAEDLARLGLHTLADLAAPSVEDLVARFGDSRGHWLHAVGTLTAVSAVTPVRERKSISSEHTFDFDVDVDADGRPELEQALRRLAVETAEGAQARGFRGRTVTLKVRTDDWKTFTRAQTLEDYTDSTELIVGTSMDLLAAHLPSRPVRLLGVRLSAFEHIERAEGEEDAERLWQQLRLPLELAGA